MKPKFTTVLILFFAGIIQAQSLTVGEAINKAGRQRTLTQQMMKCYLMIGSKVRVAVARKELDEAVALFEEQMLELQDYTPNPKVAKAILEAQELWLSYRLKIVSEPNKLGASILLKMSDKLAKECNDIVALLEKSAKVKAAKLVNLSGRQRTLSQTIATLYLAYAWQVADENILPNLQKAKTEFEEALIELASSEINTSEITRQLNNVITQWEFSKSTFEVKSSKMLPSVITVTTNSMLRKMEEITGLYARLATNQQLAARR